MNTADRSSAFGSLAPSHEDLVREYLKFVRAKRDIALQSMEGEFNDVNNDRLSEAMYSQQDVKGIMEGLRGCVVTNLRQEVGGVANMSALLIKQMLEDAERQGATLTFDTSTVEDQALLEEVERMRVDGQLQRSKGQISRLVSMKEDRARLVEESQDMHTQNEVLQERVMQLERDCFAQVRERDNDRTEVEALRGELRFRPDGKDETPSKLEQDVKGSDDFEEANREIIALKGTIARRLDESPQFQQLKRLVSSKSQQVVALRRRLARYEPDEDDATSTILPEDDSKHDDGDDRGGGDERKGLEL